MRCFFWCRSLAVGLLVSAWLLGFLLALCPQIPPVSRCPFVSGISPIRKRYFSDTFFGYLSGQFWTEKVSVSTDK